MAILPGAPVVRDDDPAPGDPAQVVVSRTLGIGSDPAYQRRFDISDTVTYTGRAAHGVASSAPGWTIMRTTLVAGVPTTETWTGVGTAVWDNRATETYT